MTSILKRVGRIKLDAELLAEAVEMHAELSEEDRSAFDVRTISLLELLDRKGLAAKKHAGLAAAIDFRLTALARLLQRHQARGWTLAANDEGAEFIHRGLLYAAAEEPLIEDSDGQAGFDPESFRARLLRLSEAKGEA